MKNHSVNTTFSAVAAFIAAAIYAILFFFGILPGVTVFAITGIFISLAVLMLFTLARLLHRGRNNGLHKAFSAYGPAVIFAAVATLCVSVLALTIPVAISVLYIAVLFLLIFFWKFLLISWGLLLHSTMSAGCSESPVAETCPQDDCDESSYSHSNKYRY